MEFFNKNQHQTHVTSNSQDNAIPSPCVHDDDNIITILAILKVAYTKV